MSEFDKLLEDVERRVCLATTGKAEAGDLAAVRFVLRETVLQLLEAGQAMYYALDGKGNSQVEIEWDKQKQAAMEGR